MADKGAHLTQSSSFLINEPSFFDAVASKSLNSYGVVKKIIDNLCHSGRNNWIRKFFTEIYFSCNILIQTYYLSNYGGSFAETFYGLTRKNKKTKGFYKKDFYFSWLCLAILPYIQIKLNNFKDNISMNIDSVDKTQQKKYKNVCIIFGKLNVILEIAKLIQFLFFFGRKTSTCSLSNEIFNLTLNYTDSTRNKNHDILHKRTSEFVFSILSTCAFFIQFMQSFDLKIPRNKTQRWKYSLSKKTELQVCPICLNTIELPTLINISGYVYCYKCIFLNMKNCGKFCPVTGYAITIKDLIILHEN